MLLACAFLLKVLTDYRRLSWERRVVSYEQGVVNENLKLKS